MIAGRFDFTGTYSIVQGKTLRLRIRLKDAAKLELPVGLYEWRAKFKKNPDGPDILFLSSNTELPGVTAGSEIRLEPDDDDGNPMEGAIELYVPDEVMEGILHTQWEEVTYGETPNLKKKYRGVWELEAEDSMGDGDTLPILAGKVNFIREIAR